MTITVRSASSGASASGEVEVSAPPQLVAGDTLWAVHVNDVSNSTSASGWTSQGSGSGNGFFARVWRRTAGLGEPDTYSFEQDGDASGVVHILAVQGADPSTSPVIAFATAFANNIPTPDVAPAGVPHAEIRVGATDPFDEEIGWSAPSGYVLRGVAQDQIGFVAAAACSRVINSSASSGPKAFAVSPESPRGSIGVSVSIASAPAVEPEIPEYPPFTPARGSARYQYRFRRLLDGQYLGHLELAGVSFDKRINQAGTFSATVPIPSREVGDLVSEVFPRDSSVLSAGSGVVVVDILRDGDVWGEYWITSHKPARSRRGTPALTLQGSTLDGYLSVVEIQSELFFEQADQIDVLRGLLASAQAQQYANTGITVAAGMSGVLRDREYRDDGGTYGARIRELAEVDNGFEYTIDVAAAGGTIARQIRWGYPTLASAAIEHTFSDGFNGGDIVEWGDEVDALRGATRWRARGGTPPSEGDASITASPLISAVHEATGHLEAGWPRIDRTLSYPDVVVQQTLEDYAAYWASVAPGALRVEQYTVVLGSSPSLHPNKVGDWARLYLDNEWHRPHWRERRIIGMQITPVSRQTGKEEARLVLEGLDVGGAPSVSGGEA